MVKSLNKIYVIIFDNTALHEKWNIHTNIVHVCHIMRRNSFFLINYDRYNFLILSGSCLDKTSSVKLKVGYSELKSQNILHNSGSPPPLRADFACYRAAA